MNNVPMSILLVEDDINECKKYKEIITHRKDVKLINYTNSATKAIEICKKYKPEAIILDLELNDGEGNGFEFIENIRKLNSSINPKIIVTTNVHSNSVYNFSTIKWQSKILVSKNIFVIFKIQFDLS